MEKQKLKQIEALPQPWLDAWAAKHLKGKSGNGVVKKYRRYCWRAGLLLSATIGCLAAIVLFAGYAKAAAYPDWTIFAILIAFIIVFCGGVGVWVAYGNEPVLEQEGVLQTLYAAANDPDITGRYSLLGLGEDSRQVQNMVDARVFAKAVAICEARYKFKLSCSREESEEQVASQLATLQEARIAFEKTYALAESFGLPRGSRDQYLEWAREKHLKNLRS